MAQGRPHAEMLDLQEDSFYGATLNWHDKHAVQPMHSVLSSPQGAQYSSKCLNRCGSKIHSAHLSHAIGPGAFAWGRLVGTQGILGRVYGHHALRTAQPGCPGSLMRHVSPRQKHQSHLHAITSSRVILHHACVRDRSMPASNTPFSAALHVPDTHMQLQATRQACQSDRIEGWP